MSFSLRTTILATGCILAVGASAAQGQTPAVYYYPAPGNYATTQGRVSIQAAGYYYNVPLNAVPDPAGPARAQMPLVYYYPAPGNYATTQGIVNIPAAGYYYNVPLNGALASARTAPAKEFPYSNFPFYYVHYSRGGASTDAGVGENYESNERRSEYGSGDDEDDPDW